MVGVYLETMNPELKMSTAKVMLNGLFFTCQYTKMRREVPGYVRISLFRRGSR